MIEMEVCINKVGDRAGLDSMSGKLTIERIAASIDRINRFQLLPHLLTTTGIHKDSAAASADTERTRGHRDPILVVDMRIGFSPKVLGHHAEHRSSVKRKAARLDNADVVVSNLHEML